MILSIACHTAVQLLGCYLNQSTFMFKKKKVDSVVIYYF